VRLKTIFSFILVIVLTFSLSAQSNKTAKADETFEYGEYFKALNQYLKLYKKGKLSKEDKPYVVYQIAECYRHLGDVKKAASKYKNAVKRHYDNPLAYFYYGQMLKTLGNYDEAIKQLEAYLQLVPKDKEARIALLSAKFSKEWYAHPTRYEIKNVKEINTKEREFSPAWANASYTKLYFTTTAKINQFTKFNNITGQFFTSIMETEYTKLEKWSEPIPLNDTVNSAVDDGVCALTDHFKTMYFTRCNIVKGKKIGCHIWKATRPVDGDWKTVTNVPLLPDSLSYGYPSISADGLTLYFTAEIPHRGYGGRDIWKVERKSTSDDWGKPINLGPEINTPGYEAYPYIRENGDLYFSSNYHPGLGGFDIFKAHYDKATHKWEVTNMKFPVNSSADDFSIIFKGDKEEGFFTSNRKTTDVYREDGESISERGRGSDDIYWFRLPKLEYYLTGSVFDVETKKPMDSVTVRLYGSNGSEIFIKTDKEGTYRQKLMPNVDYIYVVVKKGYLVNKGKVSTKDLDYNKTFTDSIYMSAIDKPIEIPNVYYDFGKWKLKEDSKIELDKLVKLLNDNPNIIIELSSYTDMVGDSASNMVLSQKRANSVVEYLISKGIPKGRLKAKGYGKSVPKRILTDKLAKQTGFVKGTVLSEDFINSLDDKDKKDLANQLNRRTEIKVIGTDYMPDF